MAPMAIGTSVQRSLTSKTIGILNRLEAYTPGIAMVRGVLVAKTTSHPISTAFLAALHAKEKNALILSP